MRCDVPVAALQGMFDTTDLAGSYRVRLIAGHAGRPSQMVEGILVLVRADSTLAYPFGRRPGDPRLPTTPFWGWMSITADQIGATGVVPFSSNIPTTPGLVLWTNQALGDARILVGQGRDLARGLYLTPSSLSAAGFKGSWKDDDVVPNVSGLFCVERLRGI
jgi:hypothetical protein